MAERRVRVRFAPSPTGPLHIGGVRTALFNYLFARKHEGDFILRIEDTDQNRYVAGAESYIIEALRWAGIAYNEGVDAGGRFGPYRQSERKEIYQKHVAQLIAGGKAYYAFDTPEELEAMRERLKNEKSEVQNYNALTRDSMKNSLTLTNDEVARLLESDAPYVVRFKMPADEDVCVKDIIRGEVKVNTSTLDDKILSKSDGMPTYHLANVVDDHLMEISHVIRGEEWLPSLPLHVMLYRAFGWESTMPEFAHLPLILKPSGKGKLSKRDGDKMGFPVFPLQWKDPKSGEVAAGYREEGYLPEAFVNILALLGWNPGTDKELFSLDELAEVFSLERVGKSGSRFDPDKARWFNHQYVQKLPDDKMADQFMDILSQKGIEADKNRVTTICGLVKERLNFVSEIWEQTAYFFEAPKEYDRKTVKKQWKTATPELLGKVREIIANTEPFTAENLENRVKEFITSNELGFGKVMNPLRLVLVGGSFGVHLFDIMALLGKDESLRRIDKGLNEIKK